MSNQVYRGKFNSAGISFTQRMNRIVGHGHLSIWLTTVFDDASKTTDLDDCLISKVLPPSNKTVPVALRYDKSLAPMVTPKQSMRLINNGQIDLTIQAF